MPAGGLLTAGIVGGVGSLLGGLFGSSAANKAGKIINDTGNTNANDINRAGGVANQGVGDAGATANRTVEGAIVGAQQGMGAGRDAANGTLANVFNQDKAALNPYLQAGGEGVTSLAAMNKNGFSFNPSNLQTDPGYQWQLSQGLKAIQASAAARGLGGGGGTAKSLNNYAQGAAGTEYQAAYNRALGTFTTNRDTATTLANVGQNANGQLLTAGMNYGNQTSANDMNAAQYTGNVGMQGSEYQGNTDLNVGAWQGGNTMNTANAAAAQRMAGAQGLAGGKMGAANAWSSAVGGVTNAVTGGMTLNSMLNPSFNSDTATAGLNANSGYIDSQLGQGAFAPPPLSLPAASGPAMAAPTSIPLSAWTQQTLQQPGNPMAGYYQ